MRKRTKSTIQSLTFDTPGGRSYLLNLSKIASSETLSRLGGEPVYAMGRWVQELLDTQDAIEQTLDAIEEDVANWCIGLSEEQCTIECKRITAILDLIRGVLSGTIESHVASDYTLVATPQTPEIPENTEGKQS